MRTLNSIRSPLVRKYIQENAQKFGVDESDFLNEEIDLEKEKKERESAVGDDMTMEGAKQIGAALSGTKYEKGDGMGRLKDYESKLKLALDERNNRQNQEKLLGDEARSEREFGLKEQEANNRNAEFQQNFNRSSELDNPNSPQSIQIREMAKRLGFQVPDDMSASQINSLKDMMNAEQNFKNRNQDNDFREKQLNATIENNKASREQTAELARQRNEATIKAAQIKRDSNADAGRTSGEKRFDLETAKDFAEYEKGKSNIAGNLESLKEARNKLAGNEVDTGFLGGLKTKIGDAVGYETEEAALREQISAAIQGTLKSILGGQYTENEGKQVMARAFKPGSSVEENLRRLDVEIAKLEGRAKDIESKYNYWKGDGKGSLRGYPGMGTSKTPSLTDEQKSRLEELRKRK